MVDMKKTKDTRKLIFMALTIELQWTLMK